MLNSTKKANKSIYVIMLLTVIVLWGIDPVVNKLQYDNYSPLALSIINTFFTALLFFAISIKKLNLIDKRFLKIAVPIGALNSFACILQRIGLLLTSPANYAFLEHLSCAFVPIALFVITKKRPTVFQLFITIICLIGCLLISGVLGGPFSLSVGDALCAISGVIFGFVIALMSHYLNGVDIILFTCFQFISYFILSVILAICLNAIKINGAPVEQFRFSFKAIHLIFTICFAIVTVGLGWLLRNTALTHLNPVFVSITSPLSAVISACVSIVAKMDVFSITLLIGATLIVTAVILSGINSSSKLNK